LRERVLISPHQQRGVDSPVVVGGWLSNCWNCRAPRIALGGMIRGVVGSNKAVAKLLQGELAQLETHLPKLDLAGDKDKDLLKRILCYIVRCVVKSRALLSLADAIDAKGAFIVNLSQIVTCLLCGLIKLLKDLKKEHKHDEALGLLDEVLKHASLFDLAVPAGNATISQTLEQVKVVVQQHRKHKLLDEAIDAAIEIVGGIIKIVEGLACVIQGLLRLIAVFYRFIQKLLEKFIKHHCRKFHQDVELNCCACLCDKKDDSDDDDSNDE